MIDGALKIGSLFSGIGLLELAVELATGGDVEFQAEVSPFRREVLGYHWPRVQRFDDVHDVTRASAPDVDIICGGFPCVGVSNAGLRRGLDDERSGLWFEYRRIVEELRPSFVFIENPRALEIRGLDQVLQGLDRLGYSTRRGRLAAGDPRGRGHAHVGAPHERQRIWILAYTDEERLRQLAERCQRVQAECLDTLDQYDREEGMADAAAERGDGRSDAAGGVTEARPQAEQRHPDVADADAGGRQGSDAQRSGRATADAARSGAALEDAAAKRRRRPEVPALGQRPGQPEAEPERAGAGWLADARARRCEEFGASHDDDGRDAPGHDDDRRREDLRVAAIRSIFRPDWPPGPNFKAEWPAWLAWLERNPGCEPGIRRAAHGSAGRMERSLRISRVAALGDSVTLQAAYWGLRGLVERRGQLGLWG